jgi:8-oxo-dGTP pyrophosphatase MutT (NUDIX family)
MLLDQQLCHPDLSAEHPGPVLHRKAARGVAIKGDKILLLFTERYNDYSFPGGGIDEGESIEQALRREMLEETGAREISVGDTVARIDERRPHWHVDYPVMHMLSHYLLCQVHGRLAAAQMECYEKANGMRPLWVKLEHAITHNLAVMAERPANMGWSIQRETLVMQTLAERYALLQRQAG